MGFDRHPVQGKVTGTSRRIRLHGVRTFRCFARIGVLSAGCRHPRSLHDLKGDPRANLLAIRLLFRQGRITGVLLDDPSGAEDQHGPLIYHAERLRVRG